MSPSLRDLGGRDPYEILGVPPTATTEQIVAAHRRKVRTAHPDAVTGNLHAATLLNLARDVLCDPAARRAYDQRASGGADTEAGAGTGADQPTGSLWDDPDVIPGAFGSPQAGWQHHPPPPDSGPVVTETYPDPPPHPPYGYPDPPAHPPPYGSPPPFPPPAPPRHVPAGSGLPLGALALILTVLCGPVGLVLGIVALSRGPAPGSVDRTCALLAVIFSSVVSCCSASYLALAFLGATTGA